MAFCFSFSSSSGVEPREFEPWLPDEDDDLTTVPGVMSEESRGLTRQNTRILPYKPK